jgi:3-dehydrosphinganine reductase
MRIDGFKNKIIYITGGSSGIGLAIAKAVAGLEAHVVIFARGEEQLRQALRDIVQSRKSSAQRLEAYSMDVTDPGAVAKTIRDCINAIGGPDILINAAGRAVPGYLKDISYKQFDETIKVNLHGVWITTAAILPYMKGSGGWIVNVSSVAGFLGLIGYTDYAASKFAVIGFSEALRNELKPGGIGVSVLCPPDTDTPGLAAEDKTKPLETRAVAGSAKLMQPENVARALIKGLRKGQFMIIPGLDGKLIWWVKRMMPSLVYAVLDMIVARAQAKKSSK